MSIPTQRQYPAGRNSATGLFLAVSLLLSIAAIIITINEIINVQQILQGMFRVGGNSSFNIYQTPPFRIVVEEIASIVFNLSLTALAWGVWRNSRRNE